jgi:hypothetical protein
VYFWGVLNIPPVFDPNPSIGFDTSKWANCTISNLNKHINRASVKVKFLLELKHAHLVRLEEVEKFELSSFRALLADNVGHKKAMEVLKEGLAGLYIEKGY